MERHTPNWFLPFMPLKSSSKILKIVLLGDSGVGKSSLVDLFVGGKANGARQSTVGGEILHKNVEMDDSTYILQIRDIAGQERYRSVCPAFYRGVHGCLLTFAINNADSFKNLTMWRTELLKYVREHDTVLPFPFVVVGNKCDVDDEARCLAADQVRLFCAAHGMTYYETSVPEALNVDKVFSVIAARARKYREAMSEGEGREEGREGISLIRGSPVNDRCC